MKRLFRRGLLLAALCTVPACVPAPSRAQEAGEATINAGARAVLEDSARAYAEASRLSLQAQTILTRGTRTQRATAVVNWQKPGQARVESTSEGFRRRFVFSAAGLVEERTQGEKVRFHRRPADPNALPSLLSLALADVDPGGQALAPLLQGQSPARAGAGLRSMALGKLLPEEVAEMGEEHDVVAATFGAEGGGRREMRWVVAREDRLLRRVQVEEFDGTNRRTSSAASLFTEVKIDPELKTGTFSYAPPAGAEEVIGFDLPFDPRLQVGAEPFAFAERDLESVLVEPGDFKNKVWLLHFWTSTDPASLKAIPPIVAAYGKHRAAGFDALGVSLDRVEATLRDAIRRNRMPWRQVLDRRSKRSLATAYGVAAVPLSLLIGRDGKIVAVNPDPAALDEMVAKALAQ